MPESTKLLSLVIGTARRAGDRQPTLKSSAFGTLGTNASFLRRDPSTR
jgi:hypothetical protein